MAEKMDKGGGGDRSLTERLMDRLHAPRLGRNLSLRRDTAAATALTRGTKVAASGSHTIARIPQMGEHKRPRTACELQQTDRHEQQAAGRAVSACEVTAQGPLRPHKGGPVACGGDAGIEEERTSATPTPRALPAENKLHSRLSLLQTETRLSLRYLTMAAERAAREQVCGATSRVLESVSNMLICEGLPSNSAQEAAVRSALARLLYWSDQQALTSRPFTCVDTAVQHAADLNTATQELIDWLATEPERPIGQSNDDIAAPPKPPRPPGHTFLKTYSPPMLPVKSWRMAGGTVRNGESTETFLGDMTPLPTPSDLKTFDLLSISSNSKQGRGSDVIGGVSPPPLPEKKAHVQNYIQMCRDYKTPDATSFIAMRPINYHLMSDIQDIHAVVDEPANPQIPSTLPSPSAPLPAHEKSPCVTDRSPHPSSPVNQTHFLSKSNAAARLSGESVGGDAVSDAVAGPTMAGTAGHRWPPVGTGHESNCSASGDATGPLDVECQLVSPSDDRESDGAGSGDCSALRRGDGELPVIVETLAPADTDGDCRLSGNGRSDGMSDGRQDTVDESSGVEVSVSPTSETSELSEPSGAGDVPVTGGLTVTATTTCTDYEELFLVDYQEIIKRIVLKNKDENGPDLKGGSQDILIVHATMADKKQYLVFCEAFIVTYRTFISSEGLIRKLIMRYRYLSRMEGAAHTRARRNTLSLLLRVTDDLCVSELTDEVVCVLAGVVCACVTGGDLPLARALRDTVVARVTARRAHALATSGTTLASLAVSARPASVHDFHSHELAEQLTVLDSELLQKIEIPEVLLWAKEQNDEKSPNLTRFTEHFNAVSYWAQTMLIQADKQSERERLAHKFLKVMKHLRRLNNYNSYLALLSALEASAIARLTWPKSITETMVEYRQLIDSSGSFANYRSALEKAQPPCLPYLGLILQDLTFVHIGNPDLSAGRINFSKRWQQFNILENLRAFLHCRYEFPRNETVLSCFDGFTARLGEEALYELSLSIKPRASRPHCDQAGSQLTA